VEEPVKELKSVEERRLEAKDVSEDKNYMDLSHD
jgi:hypothetical protein